MRLAQTHGMEGVVKRGRRQPTRAEWERIRFYQAGERAAGLGLHTLVTSPISHCGELSWAATVGHQRDGTPLWSASLK
jgi:hypothetical protein